MVEILIALLLAGIAAAIAFGLLSNAPGKGRALAIRANCADMNSLIATRVSLGDDFSSTIGDMDALVSKLKTAPAVAGDFAGLTYQVPSSFAVTLTSYDVVADPADVASAKVVPSVATGLAADPRSGGTTSASP